MGLKEHGKWRQYNNSKITQTHVVTDTKEKGIDVMPDKDFKGDCKITSETQGNAERQHNKIQKAIHNISEKFSKGRAIMKTLYNHWG